jgi:hypothetical protein
MAVGVLARLGVGIYDGTQHTGQRTAESSCTTVVDSRQPSLAALREPVTTLSYRAATGTK